MVDLRRAKNTELVEGTMLRMDSDYQPGSEAECTTMFLVAVAAAAKTLGHAQVGGLLDQVMCLYGCVPLCWGPVLQFLVSC